MPYVPLTASDFAAASTRFRANVRAAVVAGGVFGGAPDDDAAAKAAAEAKAKADADAKEREADPVKKAAHEKAELKTRAEKAEKELAERKSAEAAAKKLAEETEAKKKGEYEKLLADREKENTELKKKAERADQLEKATQTRVDAMIAKLPDAAKKEVELVKASLSIDTLESFVATKLEAAGIGIAPPAPGVKQRGGRTDKGHELHPETIGLLEDISADAGALETGKMLGTFERDGTPVFRWKGTGDDRKDTVSFIDLLKKIAYNPLRELAAEQRKRVFGGATK